jgi:hypothetical protein
VNGVSVNDAIPEGDICFCHDRGIKKFRIKV